MTDSGTFAGGRYRCSAFGHRLDVYHDCPESPQSDEDIRTDGGASASIDGRLDEVGPYDDPQYTEMNFECPTCGFSIAEWTACPECGWYDDDVWEETMQHYSECRECGQTIGAGYLCDDCDSVEVEADA